MKWNVIVLLAVFLLSENSNSYSKELPIPNWHDYHTSLTEINYNAKEKTLEISIRLFTDDLELGLTKLNNSQKVQLDATNKNDALLFKYIQQHFSITSRQKQKKIYHFIGKELEDQVTWIYVEIPDAESLNSFLLQNDLLTEIYADQTNAVNVIFLANKKTVLFTNKKITAEISF